MARRRSAAAGWTTKRYRSPLWKYAHPVRYLRGQARSAARQMRPDKVIVRALSLDEVAKAGRTKTTRVTAASRQAQVQRAAKKTAAAQKKTAAKKTAAKRADPYAAALAIPGQNRTAAAKMTQAAKKSAPMSERAIRGKGGKLAGSRPALSVEDERLYQQAKGGQVDPALLPRSARTRQRG